MGVKCLMLLMLVAAVSAVSYVDLYREEWNAFKMEFNKSYEGEVEDRFRMKVYMENKHSVARHNQRFQRGQVSFRLKINQYSDLLHHEFVHIMNGFKKTSKSKGAQYRGATFIPPAHVTYPAEVDWRAQGAVTGIKNQGHCGSCWAFSTTGALEGQHFRKAGHLVSLSEQNLIDCSGQYGNNGCHGGNVDLAFEYIKDNGGIDTENTYPYEAMNDQCRYNPRNAGADDVGYVDIPEGDEEKLMQAVAAIGPVSAAIDASLKTFQGYSDGVYYDENCSSTNLDHAVLVVGYGTDEDGKDYWLVKNSWGRSWGQLGYIKMARNRDNHCGIASDASYPLV